MAPSTEQGDATIEGAQRPSTLPMLFARSVNIGCDSIDLLIGEARPIEHDLFRKRLHTFRDHALSAGAAIEDFGESLECPFEPSGGKHRTRRIFEALDHHEAVNVAVQVRIEELRVVRE